MKKKHTWWIIAAALSIGAAAWGPIMSNVEQAKYEVVESHGRMEIRDYAPTIGNLLAFRDWPGFRKIEQFAQK